MELVRPTHVEARTGYRIYLEYADGVHGEIDLSDLAGKGIFAPWLDPAVFNQVHLAPDRTIRWTNEITLCPDALYLELTGKSLEEVYPSAAHPADA